MEPSPESVWKQCLDIIRDNISRQSFKTWFEPLKAVELTQEADLTKLTVQLPSRFYYEWLEEHYFALLRKTITKVLGPKGRLFYNIVIERDDAEAGHTGSSMNLPARQPTSEPPAPTYPAPRPAASAPSVPAPPPTTHLPRPAPSPMGYAPGTPPANQPPSAHPFAIPGIQKPPVIDSNINPTYTFERFIEGDCNRLARSASLAIA
ncbi:MAG: DnaA N-terminal domain-containing protein, partial [Bacteroidota bacterium]